jgi:hypothetical protein
MTGCLCWRIPKQQSMPHAMQMDGWNDKGVDMQSTHIGEIKAALREQAFIGGT